VSTEEEVDTWLGIVDLARHSNNRRGEEPWLGWLVIGAISVLVDDFRSLTVCVFVIAVSVGALTFGVGDLGRDVIDSLSLDLRCSVDRCSVDIVAEDASARRCGKEKADLASELVAEARGLARISIGHSAPAGSLGIARLMWELVYY